MSSLITIKTKSDFNLIYKKGDKCYSKGFTMFFYPNNELKFAFVVSKKVGNAIVRNKIKRRLRVISRSLDIQNGWILYLAKPYIKEMKFSKLEKDIKKCLSQLKQ